MSEKEKKKRELKHKVLEVLEGGLRGKPAARIFSIVMIVLILVSMLFLLLELTHRAQAYYETFEVIEAFIIGIFTLELILGFWTADVRFEGDPHPRRRYLTDFMTNIQFLAILPFYLGLILHNTRFSEFAKFFQFLKLLHLMKIGEIGVHAVKHGGEHKQEESGENEEKGKQ